MTPKHAGTGRPTAAADDRLLDLTRRLAAVISEHGLTEIEVESAGLRLRVQRMAGAGVAPPPLAAVAVTAAPLTADRPVVADTTPMAASVTIEAPMVGTFYRASSPTAEPYVREGDLVKEGQILCIIEAMKLMNEIESRAAGRVTKILVDNAQPVEYGQPLFLIEPQG
jgi:acetyl-CoA carboxylase biotin carboxyl carrier protein